MVEERKVTLWAGGSWNLKHSCSHKKKGGGERERGNKHIFDQTKHDCKERERIDRRCVRILCVRFNCVVVGVVLRVSEKLRK